MQVLKGSDLVEVPWKNGGGVTRDIAAGRMGTRDAWRISRADVACDGAFSDFAGLERILTVVSGAGMILRHAGGDLHAGLWQPVRFDGGLAVTSHLTNGPLTDLNLMFDPALCEGSARVHQEPVLLQPVLPDKGITALHILAGRPQLNGQDLEIADTAFPSGPADLALWTGDAVLEVTVCYIAQSAAIRVFIAER